MKNLNYLLLCIIVMVFCSIAVPIFLDYCIWGNHIPSSISNSDWSSFLGSFLGGVLGGLGTLIAVYVTTLETRKIQKDTDIQNQKDRMKIYNKEKFWHFSEQLASYYMNLVIIKQKLYELISEYEKKKQIEDDITNISTDIEKLKNNSDTHQIPILEKKKYEKEELLRINSILIEELKGDIILRSDSQKYSYLLFKIVLSDIKQTDSFITLIKDFENILNDLRSKDFIFSKEYKKFWDFIEKLDTFEIEWKAVVKEYESIII